jgi:hypothetical protein
MSPLVGKVRGGGAVRHLLLLALHVVGFALWCAVLPMLPYIAAWALSRLWL